MSEQAVLTERRDGVLVVTLNRPDARNAVNQAVAQGIADALDALDADDELRVGVLTGAGKGFSAGMDLRAFVKGERPYVDDRGFAGITRRAAEKPLVAAVEGFAVAGGLLRIPQRLPRGIAMELALTGDLMLAERGHELGLVNRLTEPGGALDGALELAATIAQNGPLAVAATKAIARNSADWTLAEGWERQAELIAPVFASEDAREGATAFAEKRAPVWKGR